MSAVIWFGIVAVWAFVLIPTWVRRSDIHWRRSGDTISTRDKLGRAARVVRSGGRTSGTGATVPSMRRPASSSSRRVTVAAASTSSRGGRTTVLEADVMEAQTETIPAVHVDEPPTRQIPAVGRRSAASHLDDVADAETTETTATDTLTATEAAPAAPEAEAAEPEAPMTNPRTPRPVPRRSAPGAGKATPPPHVQRARRLVWIGAAALATLLLAFVFRGWWVLINLVADAVLFVYLRHLRGIAKQQLARKARAQTARAEARPGGTRAAERVAPVRPQQRRSVPRHRAESPAPRRTVAPQPSARRTTAATAPTATAETPDVIDLTDEAMNDDCPTTELTAARAV